MLLVAAIIPLIVGFIWYNPKVFGNFWMRAAGVNPDSAKGANMVLVFGLTYLFGCFISLALCTIVIHQFGIMSLLADEPGVNDPTSVSGGLMKQMMDLYGNNFRTFKHGTLHGTMTGLFIAMPVIAINAMFERKGFKYVAVNAGYWILTLALMGGVLCAFM